MLTVVGMALPMARYARAPFFRREPFEVIAGKALRWFFASRVVRDGTTRSMKLNLSSIRFVCDACVDPVTVVLMAKAICQYVGRNLLVGSDDPEF